MLPHLASRIFGTPLLIQRAKLDVILSVIGDRIGIQAPKVDLGVSARALAKPAPPGIALIPIHGTLVKRTLGLEAASGLTSYQDIGAMLEAALADPSVKGILLDIDSPGGEASGSFELARRIRDAAKIKPVWAVANDAAFSAAYAIASAAERIVVTETGGVGSIGVIALHIDQSVKDANDGYSYTAIIAGSRKNDYSPHEPLAAAARDALQAEVDRLYGIFVDHVAAMRGMSELAVRATEAALYFGSNAMDAGLVDAVGTLESTIDEFSTHISSRGRKSPQARAARSRAILKEVSMSDEPIAMIDDDRSVAMLDEARREGVRAAQVIVELCTLAGCPEQAAAYLAEGKTEAEVRRLLLEAKAAQSEATSIHSAIDPIHERHESPVIAAVKKLAHKE